MYISSYSPDKSVTTRQKNGHGGDYFSFKVKVTSFGRAAFINLAVQPPFYLVNGLHEETILLQVLCAATDTDTVLSGYQFIPWSSEASEIHFLWPEKFTLGQCRIRTTDLSICSRTRYHWTNAPRFTFSKT